MGVQTYDQEIDPLGLVTEEADGHEYLTFILADEHYAVDIHRVQEIIGYRGFTRIPNVAKFIVGVLNLRGTVVPVVDLRAKFKLEARAYDKSTVIVILEVLGRTMGAIVDQVTDVVVLADEDIKPAPSLSGPIGSKFISGMVSKDDKFLILLDTDKVLSAEELSQVDASV